MTAPEPSPGRRVRARRGPDGQRGDSSPPPDPSTSQARKEFFAMALRGARNKQDELFALRMYDHYMADRGAGS